MGVEQDFSSMPTKEVVGQYIRGKGDHDAGKEIMRRVLDHAGLESEQYATRQLRSRDGQPVSNEQGDPVVVEDYLNHAATKYPGAIEGVLRFVLTEPSAPDFETQRTVIVEIVEATT